MMRLRLSKSNHSISSFLDSIDCSVLTQCVCVYLITLSKAEGKNFIFFVSIAGGV